VYFLSRIKNSIAANKILIYHRHGSAAANDWKATQEILNSNLIDDADDSFLLSIYDSNESIDFVNGKSKNFY
jgi:hypothetical protein